ncbi:Hydrogen peroxide-inducible genes activator [Paraburkholderia unamae]|uniref:LysR family transcriptional regulator n=1 Tax=Paraburkholderia unamae TaxID=219649 RepID=UPI000DC21387|nr:LysR family transcriptional regulator [Paraburkholderia unamae]RAR56392.1 DNA-binding transcriptional LysR family regulator [Paraburkholderia unamae]CAG9266168.1 Hydrogen peroxide-inducible genes activator [Paraburkholderia unamae]
MFIRQLNYLVTLAREQHFARAAELCNVTQPALSSAIRSLENELGLVIVRRGRRFLGLTEEGERVLGWARQTIAALDHMRQDVSAANLLTGTVRVGVIPTTMPVVSLLIATCRETHPMLRFAVRSLSSDAILRQLDEYELDIGFTYLDEHTQAGFEVMQLYRERYVLVSPSGPDESVRAGAVRWDALGELQFCLLDSSMQNRQVINAAFRRAGIEPKIVLEADSLLTLMSSVQHTGLHTVLPHSVLSVTDSAGRDAVTPIAPELTREIGLIARELPSRPPLVAALWKAAGRLDLQTRFDAFLDHPHAIVDATTAVS